MTGCTSFLGNAMLLVSKNTITGTRATLHYESWLRGCQIDQHIPDVGGGTRTTNEAFDIPFFYNCTAPSMQTPEDYLWLLRLVNTASATEQK